MLRDGSGWLRARGRDQRACRQQCRTTARVVQALPENAVMIRPVDIIQDDGNPSVVNIFSIGGFKGVTDVVPPSI
jgi:hypothetical protein